MPRKSGPWGNQIYLCPILLISTVLEKCWVLLQTEGVVVAAAAWTTHSRYCWLVILELERAPCFSVSSPTLFMISLPLLVLSYLPLLAIKLNILTGMQYKKQPEVGMWFSILWLSFECLFYYILLFISGVDFKIKQFTVSGKRLKFTIWDTGDCQLFAVWTLVFPIKVDEFFWGYKLGFVKVD